jgi:uncharacterized OB-fold protein
MKSSEGGQFCSSCGKRTVEPPETTCPACTSHKATQVGLFGKLAMGLLALTMTILAGGRMIGGTKRSGEDS